MHDLCLYKLFFVNRNLIDENEAAFKATGVIVLRQEEIQAGFFSLNIPGPTLPRVDDRFARLFVSAHLFLLITNTSRCRRTETNQTSLRCFFTRYGWIAIRREHNDELGCRFMKPAYA